MKKLALFGLTGAMLLSSIGTAFAARPGMDREEFARHHEGGRPPIIIAVNRVPATHMRVVVAKQYGRFHGKHRCMEGTHQRGHRHHDKGSRGDYAHRR